MIERSPLLLESMDDRIRALERKLAANPGDTELRRELDIARARGGHPGNERMRSHFHNDITNIVDIASRLHRLQDDPGGATIPRHQSASTMRSTLKGQLGDAQRNLSHDLRRFAQRHNYPLHSPLTWRHPKPDPSVHDPTVHVMHTRAREVDMIGHVARLLDPHRHFDGNHEAYRRTVASLYGAQRLDPLRELPQGVAHSRQGRPREIFRTPTSGTHGRHGMAEVLRDRYGLTHDIEPVDVGPSFGTAWEITPKQG